MQNKIWVAGSCNSHKSWSAALSWLCASFGKPANPPLHQAHPDFALWWKSAKTAHKTKTKEKAMARATHIYRYIRDKLQINPDAMYKSSYEDLIKALYLITTFLTISRPTELLYADKTDRSDPKNIIKRIKGLRWSDIKFQQCQPCEGYHSDEVMDLTVRWFKNQEDRRVPKVIRMASACCGHGKNKCVCAYFDIPRYIRHIKELRQNRFHNIKPFRPSGKGVLGVNQSKFLGTDPEDFVFVNSRGTRMNKNHIDDICREMAIFNNVDESKRKLTPHSLRIGATSLAHHQHIDPLKIMRYVEWKPTACPTMHSHYVRYDEVQLSSVPFQMLHGVPTNDGTVHNNLRSDPIRFELRNEVIRATLYNGSSLKPTKGLKSRAIPKMRPMVFDDPNNTD